MLNHIMIRLEDDCIRFDCADCGLGAELDINYMGYQNTPDPHFLLACRNCGFQTIRKGNGSVWRGLPISPGPAAQAT